MIDNYEALKPIIYAILLGGVYFGVGILFGWLLTMY